jgi:hypothetical protein
LDPNHQKVAFATIEPPLPPLALIAQVSFHGNLTAKASNRATFKKDLPAAIALGFSARGIDRGNIYVLWSKFYAKQRMFQLRIRIDIIKANHKQFCMNKALGFCNPQKVVDDVDAEIHSSIFAEAVCSKYHLSAHRWHSSACQQSVHFHGLYMNARVQSEFSLPNERSIIAPHRAKINYEEDEAQLLQSTSGNKTVTPLDSFLDSMAGSPTLSPTHPSLLDNAPAAPGFLPTLQPTTLARFLFGPTPVPLTKAPTESPTLLPTRSPSFVDGGFACMASAQFPSFGHFCHGLMHRLKHIGHKVSACEKSAACIWQIAPTFEPTNSPTATPTRAPTPTPSSAPTTPAPSIATPVPAVPTAIPTVAPSFAGAGAGFYFAPPTGR